MKSPKKSTRFRPFADIKAQLRNKHPRLELPQRRNKPSGRQANDNPLLPERLSSESLSDQQLFMEAMKDVTPINRGKIIEPAPRPRRLKRPAMGSESDVVIRQLERLVETGAGFVVHQTPEYMEGIAPYVHRRTAARLRNGEFSVQAHLDLHGCTVQEAREAMDRFLNASISEGKRVVLVIHGRGLSSPAKPVLKTKVFEWLQCSPWNKWVMAFTSARMVDGGAGATYVMLRKHPAGKKRRAGSLGSRNQ